MTVASSDRYKLANLTVPMRTGTVAVLIIVTGHDNKTNTMAETNTTTTDENINRNNTGARDSTTFHITRLTKHMPWQGNTQNPPTHHSPTHPSPPPHTHHTLTTRVTTAEACRYLLREELGTRWSSLAYTR